MSNEQKAISNEKSEAIAERCSLISKPQYGASDQLKS